MHDTRDKSAGCGPPQMCCTVQMPTATATKWPHDVAMGVSQWSQNHRRHASPEGTTGIVAPPIHVAPLGLCDRFNLPVHGFAPVATISRPFGTNVHAPGCHVVNQSVPRTHPLQMHDTCDKSAGCGPRRCVAPFKCLLRQPRIGEMM